MSTSSSQLLADVAKLHVDSGLMHDVIHGDPTKVVRTEGGPIKSVAGAVASLTTFTARGEWVAGTTYAFRDVYSESGIAYMVMKDHVASNVSGDLAAGKVAVYQGVPPSEFSLRLGRVVGSLGELRGLSHIVYPRVFVTGHGSAHDRGGGSYEVDLEDNVSGDNDGTTVVSISGGRYKLAHNGTVSAWVFGVRGDASDDTVALRNAGDAARAERFTLELPLANPYIRITGTVNLRNCPLKNAGSTIYVDTTAIGVILGGYATSGTNPNQDVGTVYRNTTLSQTNPAVRVIGATGAVISCKYTNFLQLWADSSISFDGSMAYSTFNLNWADRLELITNGGKGWINENVFNLNRCSNLKMDGSAGYSLNHNLIIGGTFEGPASIYLKSANDNKFHHMRFELGPTTITFDVNTDRNIIVQNWAGSEYSSWPNDPLVNGSLVNNGGPGNVVMDEQQVLRQSVVVAESNITDVVLNNTHASMVPEATRSRMLQYVGGNGGAADVCVSDLLAIERDDYYFFVWQKEDVGDTSLYRPKLYFYDKNLQPINVQPGWTASPSITSITGNVIRPSTGRPSGDFVRVTQAAINAGAMFIRVGIEQSSGQGQYTLSRKVMIMLFSYNATGNRADVATRKQPVSRPYVVVGRPTQGFAPHGFEVITSDMSARYHNQSVSDTTLALGSDVGNNTITVTDPTNFASGDVIGINCNDRSTFWTTVSGAPSGNVVTLAAAMPTLAMAGSRIVRNRWVLERITLS